MKYVLILIFFYNGTRSTGSSEIRLIITVLVFLNYFSPPWFFQRPFANLPSLPQSLPVSPLVHNFSPSSSILHAPRFCRFLALDVVRDFVIVCVSKVCAIGGKYRRGVVSVSGGAGGAVRRPRLFHSLVSPMQLNFAFTSDEQFLH